MKTLKTPAELDAAVRARLPIEAHPLFDALLAVTPKADTCPVLLALTAAGAVLQGMTDPDAVRMRDKVVGEFLEVVPVLLMTQALGEALRKRGMLPPEAVYRPSGPDTREPGIHLPTPAVPRPEDN